MWVRALRNPRRCLLANDYMRKPVVAIMVIVDTQESVFCLQRAQGIAAEISTCWLACLRVDREGGQDGPLSMP
jgi:hypothetical protein